MFLTHLQEKVLTGERLNQDECISLFDLDLLTLGEMADARREFLHPGSLATFVVDINLNYTNICNVDCLFCAFYRHRGASDSYVRTREEILFKVRELVKIGGTQVLLQGGHNSALRLDYYTDLLRGIKSEFPDVHIHSFSPSEIDFIGKREGRDSLEVLKILKEAGLDSVPGGGAEILVDRVKEKISPNKIKSERWLEIMEQANSIGLFTTATMVYGGIETKEERIEHLLKIRGLQDKLLNDPCLTHQPKGFTAFILWSYSFPNTQLSHLVEATGSEYLKMTAISRIVLDNVPNLQTGWLTESRRLAQVALSFGANDMGGILMEENVVRAAGIKTPMMTVEEMVRLIREAGKIPAQRNTRYEILKTFDKDPLLC
ncbi:MAG: dehypoxanthine futalosine cyclase [Candidatus Eremiobacteraeota bacterium]|nr:dehypoxanthine futalosine cyclase [Candidatus Eremiobacteraeota bacterium]